MSEHEDNRDELVRLIREHLQDKRLNVSAFVNQFPKALQRTVYYWISGEKIPGRVANIAILEDVLGWKAGMVREVLDAPITQRFTLAELRDWEKLEDEPEKRALRASDLTTDELMIELVRRVGALQREVDFRRRKAGEVERKSAYDLAALSTEAGRNMEHLESDQDK